MDPNFVDESFGLKLSALILNCTFLVIFTSLEIWALLKIKCAIQKQAIFLLAADSICLIHRVVFDSIRLRMDT